MNKTIDVGAILNHLTAFAEQVQVLLKQPTFWAQFVVIAAVFVIARWVLAPAFHRFPAFASFPLSYKLKMRNTLPFGTYFSRNRLRAPFPELPPET